MSVRKLGKSKTGGGSVFWTDKYEYHGWRIQYNKTLDNLSPLKPYRLLDSRDRLMASGDSEEDLVETLPVLMESEEEILAENYSEESLWEKVKSTPILRKLLVNVFTLYYLLEDKTVPKWAKIKIFAALGYFITPFDVIPDVVVPLGFTDDAAIIAYAVVKLASHITPELKRKAENQADVFCK